MDPFAYRTLLSGGASNADAARSDHGNAGPTVYGDLHARIGPSSNVSILLHSILSLASQNPTEAGQAEPRDGPRPSGKLAA